MSKFILLFLRHSIDKIWNWCICTGKMTMVHWIRLSLLCRCKWTRKSDLWGKMFQSNIYYYASIEGVLCISGKDKPRRTKRSWIFCQTNQDSCACTRFLCMHNTLVHAQHSCACKEGARAQGRDPKRALGVRPGGPLQCMRKSVVHAQECCAYTRILCMHKNLDLFDKISNFYWYVLVRLFHLCIIHLLCLHNNKHCSETFSPRDLIFTFIYTYTVD